MTTETTTAPTADMLIIPRMTPEPSPLRVSTFVQPEYAKLTFLYGKGDGVSPTTPVYCREFVIKIPTGLQAGALTAEPDLIRYDLTVTGGGRGWRIDKNARDPNQVIFTCMPPYQETAKFDGTWQAKLELWGIEVNTGVGPVGITFEEETSRTGNENDWVVRTGCGEVSKRDDSFFLHSFRPATTVTGHDTSVQLTWVGAADAIYSISYRDADGVNKSVSVNGGTWTSPKLKYHTDFILKATKSGQDFYLTTSVEVKEPAIVATTVTANGLIKANGCIEVNGEPEGGVKNSYLWIRKGARLDLEESTTANVESAKLNAYGPVAVKGLLAANGGATLGADKDLTIPGGTGKLVVAGSFEAQAYKSGVANWGKVKVFKVLAVGDIGDAESNAYGLYVGVPIKTDITFDVGKILTVSKIKGTGNWTELILNGITRIDGTLRGPGGAATEPVNIPGPLTVGGTLEGKWIKPALGITVPKGQAIYINGKRVLVDGDLLDLRVTNGSRTWYLYCTWGSGHHAAGPYVVGGNPSYTNSLWRVRYWSSSALGMNASDVLTGPDDTEAMPSE